MLASRLGPENILRKGYMQRKSRSVCGRNWHRFRKNSLDSRSELRQCGIWCQPRSFACLVNIVRLSPDYRKKKLSRELLAVWLPGLAMRRSLKQKVSNGTSANTLLRRSLG